MVSLAKGQAISLKKNDGGTLKRVAMGTGWDGVKKKGGFFGFGGGKAADIDLDASALVYEGTRLVDQVWFRQLSSKDGNIVHSGDNRTGDGDGDDETINIDLARLASSVTAIVLTVNSFSGQSFSEVENAYTRVVDLDTGKEVARFSLSDTGPHTGLVMAVLKRQGSGWEMKAIGDRASGRTFHDMQGEIQRHL
jgi:tellurium resistance protein TerZ